MAKFSPQEFRNGSVIPSVLHGRTDSSVSTLLKGTSGIAPNHTAGEVYRRKPSIVMCEPRYLSTAIPNNVHMKQEKVDVKRAMSHYNRIKRLLTALDVKVLEVPPVKGAQDQSYTANLFTPINPFIVLAKMSAPGRTIEEEPGRRFFEQRGYTVIQPPYFQEGQADLIRFDDGRYFGGYGIHSDIKSYDWISKKCGVEIIPIHEIEPALFHLDCVIQVLEKEKFIVCREGMSAESFKKVEKLGDVILVPKKFQSCGVTNIVKIPGNKKVAISGAFFPERDTYVEAMEWMLEMFDNLGWSIIFVDTDQHELSGADCSCLAGYLDF
jgi:N-dimethylarginine dimethylaminohydrolase